MNEQSGMNKKIKETIIKINAASLTGDAAVKILAKNHIDKAIILIKYNQSEVLKCEILGGGRTELNETLRVKNPKLWSVSSPSLYCYDVEIIFTNGEREFNSGKFGFRTLSTDGKNILLNGKPIFIRGYIRGATAHEHSNLLNLSKKEFYEKNILQAKKFGFNYIRFHSVVPDVELFEAADELGMLVHIELRPPHDIYNNLEEMVTTGNAIVPEDFLVDVVNTVYNHPSLAVYCIGNEIKKASADTIAQTKKTIDNLDGTRLFLDTCAWGENGRSNIDFDVQHLSYYFPHRKHSGMYDDTDNLLVVSTNCEKPLRTEGENSEVVRSLHFNVPLIAHEVCHYTALRDFYALKTKFKKSQIQAPWWIDEEIKMIEEKGFKNLFSEMFKASKRFQFACWKTAFEEMRKSKLLGGFHFLQFADTDFYENSNGVVDCFDDESFVNPDEFLKFNGDCVIIADFKSRNYFSGDEVIVPVYFSNLGEDSIKFADFSFTVKSGNCVCSKGEMKNIDVEKKGCYEICKIKFTMPKNGRSDVLNVSLRLAVGQAVISENEWTIWKHLKPKKRLSYSEFSNYDDGSIIVTTDIEKAVTKANEGGKVCLIYRSELTRDRKYFVGKEAYEKPKYAFKASWNRFKPVIWDRGTNFGGIVNEKILSEYGFPCGKYYDFNFEQISEDCDKIILDDFPVTPDILIRGIDKSSRDRFDAYKNCYNLPELMYDRTLRDFGYLFSFRVGKGVILVCGLNLTSMDKNDPAASSLAEFILRYLAEGKFDCQNSISKEKLLEYAKACAEKPVKERTMTQFWELDDAPVESPKFWADAKEYLKNE